VFFFINDTWKWLLDHIQDYSARGTYQFLTSADEPMDRGIIDNVWHKQVPSNVSVFLASTSRLNSYKD